MQIAGTSIDFKLGERTYKFSPLTLGDIADFESWVKGRRLKEALAALGDTTAAERAQMIAQMINSNDPMLVQSEMSSMAGVQHLLYLSLRHAAPEITEEIVGDNVSMNNIDELNALLDALMSDGVKEKSNDPPAQKPPAGQP
jgi:hypothetical protein